MNKYFVTMSDDVYGNEAEVIDALTSEDAARFFIEDHYMEDEYGERVMVYEPKVAFATYEIAQPEMVLEKVPNKKESK